MKKTAALLSVFTLCAALLLFYTGDVRAAYTKEDIIFVAVSGTIMPLQAETMPFVEGNQTYVPAYLFSDGLGVKINPDTPDGFLMSYFGKAVMFSKTRDEVYDGNMVYYQNRIHYKNEIYFVPLEFTCERLEIPYRIIKTTPILIRLRQAEGDINDKQLLETFAKQSPKLVADFLKKANAGDTGTPGTAGQSGGSAQAYKVHLLITGGPNSHTAELLNLLSARGVKATFFLQGGLIPGNEELVRRIVIEGHTVGISSWSGQSSDFASPEAALAALDRSNDALDRALHTRVRLVCPTGTSSGLSDRTADAIVSAGYRYWDRNIAAYVRGGLTTKSAVVNSFSRALKTVRSTLTIELRNTAGSRGILDGVLDTLEQYRTTYRPVSDLIQPVNLRNDTR